MLSSGKEFHRRYKTDNQTKKLFLTKISVTENFCLYTYISLNFYLRVQFYQLFPSIGSVSWQQHYVGADYDSRWDDDAVLKSGRPGGYMNCETCEGVGFGLEGFTCRGCNGKLSAKCTKCGGQGRLVYQRTLNVQYNNHCSWAIVNDTPIPHR